MANFHGELLKLGFHVAQSTVSKYMTRAGRRPSQSWKTFLQNHAAGIAVVDFLIVPTVAFERLFVFVVLGLGRRRILWSGVTTNPVAEWLTQQITEAFPWDTTPRYLVRDNDGAYGMYSGAGFGPWEFVIAPSRPGLHGRMAMSNG
jgi:hypothetical protein